MSISNVRSALIQHYVDGAFGLATVYENRKTEIASGDPWAKVHFIPSQPVAVTGGNQGSDRFDGFLQIDIFYPLGSGEDLILAKADAIIQTFKAGTKLTFSGQAVTLKASGRSQGNIVNSQYRIRVDAGFYAYVSRA